VYCILEESGQMSEDRPRGSRGEAGKPETMQRIPGLVRRRGAIALCSLLVAGCGSSSPTGDSGSPSGPPLIESFTSAASAVHVGESTQLTALFSGAMQVGRVVHSAILLTDGRVLVLGGLQASAATDIFDPTEGRWSSGPILEPAWGASTATLLRNGRVLVFGGEGTSGFPVSTVILYE
jgi:hypothetical protein